MRWDIPLPDSAREYARSIDSAPHLCIGHQPLFKPSLRNWRAEYYAEVADYAASNLGLSVDPVRRSLGAGAAHGRDIQARMQRPCINAIGKDTLVELLATLARAKVLLTPDSGPAHMATAVGTPVIGLYAATNPARTGPYLSRQWCVDKYDVAAQRLLHKSAAEIAMDHQDRAHRCHGSHHAGRSESQAACGRRGAGQEALRHTLLMQDILTPISPGELIDKLTILEIKAERIRMRPSWRTCATSSSCCRKHGASLVTTTHDPETMG